MKLLIFTPRVVLIIFFSFLIYSFNTPAVEKTVKQYAQECSRKLGDAIPDFDCLDGVKIPIYSNGIEVDENTRKEECDNPSLINKVENPCATGSRLGVWKRSKYSKVLMVFICRKYRHRPSINRYDDVAIIQHNEITGATCWYQSGNMDKNGIGSKIKSPINSNVVNESSTVEWEQPSKFKQNKCVMCHTSDPFIYTRYLRKILKKELLDIDHITNPNYYFPPYYFPANKTWNNLRHIRFISPTPGSMCTKCHRIAQNPSGTGDCEKYLNDSVGFDYPSSIHSKKHMRWMPPPKYKKSLEDLKIIVNDLKECCQNPDGIHCESIPITGNK